MNTPSSSSKRGATSFGETIPSNLEIFLPKSAEQISPACSRAEAKISVKKTLSAKSMLLQNHLDKQSYVRMYVAGRQQSVCDLDIFDGPRQSSPLFLMDGVHNHQ